MTSGESTATPTPKITRPALQKTTAALLLAALLLGLNLYLCRELFVTEYFDNLQSNEGVLVTVAHFFSKHPTAKWFPFWNAGLPVENSYSPTVPALIAVVSAVTRLSPPLTLHILCGLFFCLVPLTWFWLFYRWGMGALQAFAGGLLYSLISPSLLPIRPADVFDSRRLLDVVYYGDIAHMVALAILPLALLALERFIRQGSKPQLLLAVACSAFTSLSDQFGITALCLCSLALLASLEREEFWRGARRILLAGVCTYLCTCRFLTPELMRTVFGNSQLLSGDYRFHWITPLGWAFMIGALALVRWRSANAGLAVRFILLLACIFTSIYALYFVTKLPILPVTERYDLEVDLSIAFLLVLCVWRMPVRVRTTVLAVGLVAAFPQAVRLRKASNAWLKPIEITRTIEWRGSRWIADNLPGVRVMVGGAATYWFGFWTDNPQLSGGHDGFAPNMMQRIAVFTIYTGQNAGNRDAAYATFWMKAFGVGAIYVPGERSPDRVHPFVRPEKFEGVLPVLWRQDDTSVYAVNSRTRSLAHVIPADAVVTRRPVHGLDTAPAERYVQALDDTSLPLAELQWQSPDKGRINGSIGPGQVVAVQVTYDRGWTASSRGKNLAVKADALGLMVIDPAQTGEFHIDLAFTGGPQRKLLTFVSLAAIAMLFGWLLIPYVRRGIGNVKRT